MTLDAMYAGLVARNRGQARGEVDASVPAYSCGSACKVAPAKKRLWGEWLVSSSGLKGGLSTIVTTASTGVIASLPNPLCAPEPWDSSVALCAQSW
jgi:hypothetical protein